MNRIALVAASLVIAAVAALPARAASPVPGPRPGTDFAIPLYGTVVRIYAAPNDPYAPGHRGVDVAAPLGSPVRASADGTVSYAGNVAGNLTVTVDHAGSVKTSYSYLGAARVKRGQRVLRGDVVGEVGRGHDTSLPPNVHLSARRNNVYFDPLELYVGASYADLVELVA